MIIIIQSWLSRDLATWFNVIDHAGSRWWPQAWTTRAESEEILGYSDLWCGSWVALDFGWCFSWVFPWLSEWSIFQWFFFHGDWIGFWWCWMVVWWCCLWFWVKWCLTKVAGSEEPQQQRGFSWIFMNISMDMADLCFFFPLMIGNLILHDFFPYPDFFL